MYLYQSVGQRKRHSEAGCLQLTEFVSVCRLLQYPEYLNTGDSALNCSIMPVMPLPVRRFPSELVPDEAHVVQFYTHDGVLLDGLASSFGSSLRAGESVIVVMTKSHEKGLRKRLTAQGINLEEAVEQGRFVAMDACKALDLFMDRGGPNRQKFLHEFGNIIRTAENAAVNNKRVVVFGEMVAVLWKKKQIEAAIRLEQLWNELAKTRFFFLHCAYPAKGMLGEPYHMICAEHAVVLPA
jgi:MEDS: MEthanogen/methylotroph, DcmR Sensory domain